MLARLMVTVIKTWPRLNQQIDQNHVYGLIKPVTTGFMLNINISHIRSNISPLDGNTLESL